MSNKVHYLINSNECNMNFMNSDFDNFSLAFCDAKYKYYLIHFSKSAQETLELAKMILNEACDSSDACAVRLFYTCRNVFEMYAGLVPEHHKKFLKTIPQQVGKNDT